MLILGTVSRVVTLGANLGRTRRALRFLALNLAPLLRRGFLYQVSNSTYVEIMMIYVNSWDCQSGGTADPPAP